MTQAELGKMYTDHRGNLAINFESVVLAEQWLGRKDFWIDGFGGWFKGSRYVAEVHKGPTSTKVEIYDNK